ncbi:hypothetical protein [Desulfolutivibrio sulfoxidireducens]|uniref:hypothetical protein n=1 Tax=Desulfolutivibrio sulfoxidireducens TaxID=2773299 RepID=UPI00159E0A76|nr:hypothetical protein [Desulfolutivibrio sulfoxidireducens]QLA16438.1 hypothetical protein GD605_10060 [Desulfolutivibrio sulfoxidireducens]
MPGVVRKLPGRHCRHFVRGRCFLEEHRNPGLDRKIRCGVFIGLAEAFDAHWRRFEAFGLDEAAAARIWNERFPDLLDRQSCCRHYLPGDNENFLGCVHAEGDICLRAMPVCPGQCPFYVLSREPLTNG